MRVEERHARLPEILAIIVSTRETLASAVLRLRSLKLNLVGPDPAPVLTGSGGDGVASVVGAGGGAVTEAVSPLAQIECEVSLLRSEASDLIVALSRIDEALK